MMWSTLNYEMWQNINEIWFEYFNTVGVLLDCCTGSTVLLPPHVSGLRSVNGCIHQTLGSARIFNADCVNSHQLSEHTDVCWCVCVLSPDRGWAQGAAANVAWRQRMARHTHSLYLHLKHTCCDSGSSLVPTYYDVSDPAAALSLPLWAKLAVVWFMPSLSQQLHGQWGRVTCEWLTSRSELCSVQATNTVNAIREITLIIMRMCCSAGP